MKKQYKTYTLLSVVLIVWGAIGYRIIKTINPPVKPNPIVALNEKFTPKKIKAQEEFNIVADYRDPFLGTLKASKKAFIKKAVKFIKKEVPKKNINYTGFVIDQANKEKIFFVTIEGQQQMMSLKSTVNDVTLLQGTKRFIRVAYNGITEKIDLNR